MGFFVTRSLEGNASRTQRESRGGGGGVSSGEQLKHFLVSGIMGFRVKFFSGRQLIFKL